MTWYEARDRAIKEGGRLPTTHELKDAKINVGGDKWIPATASKDDKETGRRDGYKENGENCWAHVGDRRYKTEYPEWGLRVDEECAH